MKIETIYDKGTHELNEDALLIADPVFGVFDGTSSLEPYRDELGQTGAAIASSIARKVFSTEIKSLVELAHDANEAIYDAMCVKGIDTSRKTSLWSTTAAMVKLNKDSFDWLQIGDSLVLAISTNGSFQLLINDYEHDLETMVLWQELAHKKTENIWGALNENIFKVRNEVNVKFGCLNGEKEMSKFLNHGTAALDGVAHILLFTDGLFIPKENPREPDDFKTFVDLFLDGGLKKVQHYVRELEAADPKCWKYPRFSEHDDIAAIALSF